MVPNLYPALSQDDGGDAGAESIALHAQTYAQSLYESAGYEEYGPTFVEEGIEHVAMEKRLA